MTLKRPFASTCGVLQLLGANVTLSVVTSMPNGSGDGTGQVIEGASTPEEEAARADGHGPSPDSPSADAPVPRVLWFRDRLLFSAVVTVLVIDQASKYLVKTNLRLHESWPKEGLLRLTHGTNTGTAFGLFPDQTFVLILASFFAIGFLYYFYRTQALPSRLLRLAIGLQLGGAFGNLFDRIKDGAVVDFIDVGWWPVFNLADSSIVVGITVLVSVVLLSKGADQTEGLGDQVESPLEPER